MHTLSSELSTGHTGHRSLLIEKCDHCSTASSHIWKTGWIELSLQSRVSDPSVKAEHIFFFSFLFGCTRASHFALRRLTWWFDFWPVLGLVHQQFRNWHVSLLIISTKICSKQIGTHCTARLICLVYSCGELTHTAVSSTLPKTSGFWVLVCDCRWAQLLRFQEPSADTHHLTNLLGSLATTSQYSTSLSICTSESLILEQL